MSSGSKIWIGKGHDVVLAPLFLVGGYDGNRRCPSILWRGLNFSCGNQIQPSGAISLVNLGEWWLALGSSVVRRGFDRESEGIVTQDSGSLGHLVPAAEDAGWPEIRKLSSWVRNGCTGVCRWRFTADIRPIWMWLMDDCAVIKP